eukprot:3441478-Pyramimonas_sp.AAC.1
MLVRLPALAVNALAQSTRSMRMRDKDARVAKTVPGRLPQSPSICPWEALQNHKICPWEAPQSPKNCPWRPTGPC